MGWSWKPEVLRAWVGLWERLATRPGERCMLPQWRPPSPHGFWCFLCFQVTSPAIENPACTAQVWPHSGPSSSGDPVHWTAWTPLGFYATGAIPTKWRSYRDPRLYDVTSPHVCLCPCSQLMQPPEAWCFSLVRPSVCAAYARSRTKTFSDRGFSDMLSDFSENYNWNDFHN